MHVSVTAMTAQGPRSNFEIGAGGGAPILSQYPPAVPATDSDVTALSVATTFTVMCTSLPHSYKHRCHTSVHSNVRYSVVIVTVAPQLSVYIADTLMLLPSLSQR